MKTFEELNEFLKEFDMEDCVFFSEEETVSAIVGYEDSERCLVYDYDKLIKSFMEHFRKYDTETAKSDEELYTEAVEWVDYNTLRSLPYKQADYVVVNEKGEDVETCHHYSEAKEKLKDGWTIKEIPYKMPIVIHSIEQYGY